MAEPGNGGQGGAPGNQPNLSVLTQYVKDFSFENPGAPQSLRPRQQPPAINVSIGVQSQPVGGNDIEVELRIDARAVEGQAVLFAAELIYAGIFRLANIPAEQVRPVALIECPRLLFPFARQIIAEASRNGGFPPLLIDPVDFVAMFRQQAANEQAQGASAPN
jgi:preprotein translocase subunit SecB